MGFLTIPFGNTLGGTRQRRRRRGVFRYGAQSMLARGLGAVDYSDDSDDYWGSEDGWDEEAYDEYVREEEAKEAALTGAERAKVLAAMKARRVKLMAAPATPTGLTRGLPDAGSRAVPNATVRGTVNAQRGRQAQVQQPQRRIESNLDQQRAKDRLRDDAILRLALGGKKKGLSGGQIASIVGVSLLAVVTVAALWPSSKASNRS